MSISKQIKTILFAVVYGFNLLSALALWGCGKSGNIMIGILCIVFYRLSLWFAPAAVTIICWLPLKSQATIKTKLLFNLVHLVFCGLLFVLCRVVFGNWC